MDAIDPELRNGICFLFFAEGKREEREIMAEVIRVAAVGDIHCTRSSRGALRPLFTAMAEKADVLALCGDLTDYGLPEEGKILIEELRDLRGVDIIAVMGNHDYESGKPKEIHDLLEAGGVTVLDGDACVMKGIGFAGVKGFGGGFDGTSLEAWGEPTIKQFVHEAVDESLKLESALSRLKSRRKVALLHYAPIRDTALGEPLEIFPFLGSRRLEAPLNRFPVDVVLHGHCHHGSTEGKTSTGIPVYNVAMPLLKKTFPNSEPFRILTFDLASESGQQAG